MTLISPNASAETWATAVSRHRSKDSAIIFRYIKDFPAGFNKSSQPVKVIVVWKYSGNNGMPPKNENERMVALEDALEPFLNKDKFATLALVSTGDNLREWTYYAKSEEEFFVRLNNALKGMPAFPIEIHVGSDPKWQTYENFKSGVKE